MFLLLLAFVASPRDDAPDRRVARPAPLAGATRGTSPSGVVPALLGFATDVHVFVLTTEGQPFALTSVRIGPVEGITDEDGYVLLSAVPWGAQNVLLEGDLVPSEGVMPVLGAVPLVLHLTAYEMCPGRIRLIDGDDTPVAGASVWTGGPSAEAYTSDADGWLDLDPNERLCGRSYFTIDVEGMGMGVEGTVEGAEDLVLQLPAPRDAEIWIVDAEDRFVDADVSDNGRSETSRLGIGKYALLARGMAAAVTVRSETGSASATVPLDGEVHLIRVEAPRDLVVHAVCDPVGCPAIMCDDSPCESTDAHDFACSCWRRHASLMAREPETRVVFVRSDVTEIDFDVRAEHGTVRGTWAGAFPMTVGSMLGGTTTTIPEFEIDLPPGDQTLHFFDRDEGAATRTVHVEPGAAVDLGVVTPDATRVLEGRIVADFPVRGTLFVSGGAEHAPDATLQDDGSFRANVPMTWSEVQLTWLSLDSGRFRGSFAVGAPILWTVSWRERREGLSDEDLDSFDTGLY